MQRSVKDSQHLKQKKSSTTTEDGTIDDHYTLTLEDWESWIADDKV